LNPEPAAAGAGRVASGQDLPDSPHFAHLLALEAPQHLREIRIPAEVAAHSIAWWVGNT
jgi:hypothetical protein